MMAWAWSQVLGSAGVLLLLIIMAHGPARNRWLKYGLALLCVGLLACPILLGLYLFLTTKELL
jgi:hypothetical protein